MNKWYEIDATNAIEALALRLIIHDFLGPHLLSSDFDPNTGRQAFTFERGKKKLSQNEANQYFCYDELCNLENVINWTDSQGKKLTTISVTNKTKEEIKKAKAIPSSFVFHIPKCVVNNVWQFYEVTVPRNKVKKFMDAGYPLSANYISIKDYQNKNEE